MAGSGAGNRRKDKCSTNCGGSQPRCDVLDCSFHGFLLLWVRRFGAMASLLLPRRPGVVTADTHSNLLLAGTSHFLWPITAPP